MPSKNAPPSFSEHPKCNPAFIFDALTIELTGRLIRRGRKRADKILKTQHIV
jgi:hypothetical protein